MQSFDPRAWNIFAGLCVATGCGSRLIGADESASDTVDTADTSESNTTVEGPETDGVPECVTDADCGYGYYCQEGICEYGGYHDGHLDYHSDYQEDSWGECYVDTDCAQLEICDFNYCYSVRSPEACEAPDPVPGLTIPIASLALSFADVDADGADELVVATQSELHVYESGSDAPIVSLRGLDSDSIDAMDAAQLDAMPGEDVVILYADELRLHASDGIASFMAPSVRASNWPDSVGLLAGDFEGVAPDEALIWASSGAGVDFGNGNYLELSVEQIGSAIARSLSEPVGGFVLQHGSNLDFYTSAGAEVGNASMRAESPYALTSIAELGDGLDLSSSLINSLTPWTIIQSWGPATGNSGVDWGVLGMVTAMAGGDFDGDGFADVALIIDSSVQVQFGVLTETTCLAFYPFAAIARDVVDGDHDGDGDDEIAIRFEGGNVTVLDGE
jgi:hypothetical protein